MHLVFARNKPKIDLERRNVFPGKNDLTFRCGKCGYTFFTVHVRPTKLCEARISEVVCWHCRTVFNFDDVGRLERGGKINGRDD